jgi:L-ribulose-5-phosphate 3-epimerase
MNGSPHFGIVQGRLTRSPPGCLQWFPQESWRAEFAAAEQLGIDFIELIAEVQHNPDNPIWSDDGISEIRALCSRHNLVLHALCNDFIIEHNLLDGAKALDQCLEVIERAKLLGVEKLVLPFFEASDINSNNIEDFVAPLRIIIDACENMTASIETNLDGRSLIDFLELVERPALKVVFDTGNRAAAGHNLGADIGLLRGAINHVHIKDKGANNENVLLGNGLVNFADVFAALENIGYQGPYTFETQRGEDPLATAASNINLVNSFKRLARDRA